MKFSESLLQKLQHDMVQYKAQDLTDKNVFIKNLVFAYHVIRASEHLLQIAHDKSDGILKEYFSTHLEEEKSHEKWLAEDLNSADVQVQSTAIPRLAVEMVGSQYYLIHHVSPCALLGYMARLECFPFPMKVVEELEEVHGKKLVRTLRYHAVHDVEHREDLLNMLDELPTACQLIALESAIQTTRYFGIAQQGFAS
jgi:hypothetical protein